MTRSQQTIAVLFSFILLHNLGASSVFAGGPSIAPATSPAIGPQRTSLWGNAVNGLQARLLMPAAVEQNSLIPIRFQIACDPDHLPLGVDRLDTFLLPMRVSLLMKNVKSGRTVKVRPMIPTHSIPVRNTGDDFVPLDGTPIKVFEAEVALRPADPAIEPGEYDCVLNYPSDLPTFPGELQPPNIKRCWGGNLATASIRMRVQPETPKIRQMKVPTRVHLDADRVLRCDEQDMERINVSIRNGCFLGTRITRNGGAEMLTGDFSLPAAGGVVFDDPTPEADAKAGAGNEVSYTIEVFETETPPQHMWMPMPGQDGYKSLWKRVYKVTSTRQ